MAICIVHIIILVNISASTRDANRCSNSPLQTQGTSMDITAHPSPHSYLAVVIISFCICALLNVTSMGLGIPALTLTNLVSLYIQSYMHWPWVFSTFSFPYLHLLFHSQLMLNRRTSGKRLRHLEE